MPLRPSQQARPATGMVVLQTMIALPAVGQTLSFNLNYRAIFNASNPEFQIFSVFVFHQTWSRRSNHHIQLRKSHTSTEFPGRIRALVGGYYLVFCGSCEQASITVCWRRWPSRHKQIVRTEIKGCGRDFFGSMVDNLVLQVTRGYPEPYQVFNSGYVHLTGVGDGLSIS